MRLEIHKIHVIIKLPNNAEPTQTAPSYLSRHCFPWSIFSEMLFLFEILEQLQV